MASMTKTEELLVRELKAARLALQKMKSEFNQFDDGFAIGKVALARANKTLKDFRQRVALPASSADH